MILDVYGKPNCPWCVKMIDFLENHGYDYSYIDISVREGAKEFLLSQEIKTVPAVFINGDYLGGYEKTVSELE